MSNSNYAVTGAVAFAPVRPILASAAVGIRSVLARIAAFLAAQAAARAQNRRARESGRQLMALSNRELKDIGISRSEILSVVYGPADGRRVESNGVIEPHVVPVRP
jgi:uncharacterized protein YjiS (DUF1127 family)